MTYNVFGGTLNFAQSINVCNAVLAIVKPSVRLSGKRVNCDKTKEISAEIFKPYKRSMHLVL